MTMGIPIVAGRGFEATDTASGGRVVIVNKTLANRLWKGRDPIGQRVRPNLGASIGSSVNPWHTVIGVAKDVKEAGVDRDAGAELYLFVDQPGPPIDGTERWVTNAPPTMHHRPAHEPSSVCACADSGAGGARRSTPRSRSWACARWMPCSTIRSAGRDCWRSCSAHSPGWRCCWQSSARMACSRSWSRSGGVRSASVSPSARRAAASSRSSRGRDSPSCQSVLPSGWRARSALTRLLGSLLFGVRPTDPATRCRRHDHDCDRCRTGVRAPGLARLSA